MKRVPLSCIWEITNGCNLRCVHCESASGNRRSDEFSTEEGVALAKALGAAGCRTVNLTGGEPLTRSDWPVLAATASDLGMRVHLVTNGVLFDDAAVRLAEESRVFGVAVSVDGPREVHDAMCLPAAGALSSRYDSAMQAIARISSSSLKTGVITMVHRENLTHLDAMYEQFATMGVDSWQVQIAMPLGRMRSVQERYMLRPSDIGRLEALLAKFIGYGRMAVTAADNIGYYGPNEPCIRGMFNGEKSFWQGCIAGCRAVAVTAVGDVLGCPSHPVSLRAGNIREETFQAIWNDDARFGYNTRWEDSALDGACAACPFGRICRAGCTTMALASTGTIYNNRYCLKHAPST